MKSPKPIPIYSGLVIIRRVVVLLIVVIIVVQLIVVVVVVVVVVVLVVGVTTTVDPRVSLQRSFVFSDVQRNYFVCAHRATLCADTASP